LMRGSVALRPLLFNSSACVIERPRILRR
jgi:hypothetical protein